MSQNEVSRGQVTKCLIGWIKKFMIFVESIGEVVKDKSIGGQYDDQFGIWESLLWLWAEGLDWIGTRLVIETMTRTVILKEMM